MITVVFFYLFGHYLISSYFIYPLKYFSQSKTSTSFQTDWNAQDKKMMSKRRTCQRQTPREPVLSSFTATPGISYMYASQTICTSSHSVSSSDLFPTSKSNFRKLPIITCHCLSDHHLSDQWWPVHSQFNSKKRRTVRMRVIALFNAATDKYYVWLGCPARTTDVLSSPWWRGWDTSFMLTNSFMTTRPVMLVCVKQLWVTAASCGCRGDWV